MHSQKKCTPEEVKNRDSGLEIGHQVEGRRQGAGNRQQGGGRIGDGQA